MSLARAEAEVEVAEEFAEQARDTIWPWRQRELWQQANYHATLAIYEALKGPDE